MSYAIFAVKAAVVVIVVVVVLIVKIVFAKAAGTQSMPRVIRCLGGGESLDLLSMQSEMRPLSPSVSRRM